MKRIFDLIISLLTILIFTPLFLALFIIVYFDVGWPIFTQKRIGLNNKIFSLLKFKSMRDIDIERNLVTNEQRITKLGRFLRRTSLDELPSLINIVKGEMSLVGPRPLLIDYLPFYRPEHRIRHTVKPGLTGLAQINGRNQITWERRLNLDVYYVQNRNVIMDLKILFLTVGKVFKKEGVENSADLSIVRLDEDETYLNKE